jgi:hypothetical protein
MSAEELWGWWPSIQTRGSWDWESKEHAEVTDFGCTAGLQLDKEPRAQMHQQIKHQGQVIDQTTCLVSTALSSQGK